MPANNTKSQPKVSNSNIEALKLLAEKNNSIPKTGHDIHIEMQSPQNNLTKQAYAFAAQVAAIKELVKELQTQHALLAQRRQETLDMLESAKQETRQLPADQSELQSALQQEQKALEKQLAHIEKEFRQAAEQLAVLVATWSLLSQYLQEHDKPFSNANVVLVLNSGALDNQIQTLLQRAPAAKGNNNTPPANAQAVQGFKSTIITGLNSLKKGNDPFLREKYSNFTQKYYPQTANASSAAKAASGVNPRSVLQSQPAPQQHSAYTIDAAAHLNTDAVHNPSKQQTPSSVQENKQASRSHSVPRPCAPAPSTAYKDDDEDYLADIYKDRAHYSHTQTSANTSQAYDAGRRKVEFVVTYALVDTHGYREQQAFRDARTLTAIIERSHAEHYENAQKAFQQVGDQLGEKFNKYQQLFNQLDQLINNTSNQTYTLRYNQSRRYYAGVNMPIHDAPRYTMNDTFKNK